MDRTYPLHDDIINSHERSNSNHLRNSYQGLSQDQQAQRIRFQRLKQQRNRMQSLSEVITSSHRTILTLQTKIGVLQDQSKKWEIMFLQSQKQNNQLKQRQKIMELQIQHQRNQKNKFISFNTQLKEKIFRIQNQSKLMKLNRQQVNQGSPRSKSSFDNYQSLNMLEKFAKLEKKLLKRQKQNAALRLQLNQPNKSFDEMQNISSNKVQKMNLQKFMKKSKQYNQIKTQLKKISAYKEKQLLSCLSSRNLGISNDSKQMKVCPCHYIGKASKSKRKHHDIIY